MLKNLEFTQSDVTSENKFEGISNLSCESRCICLEENANYKLIDANQNIGDNKDIDNLVQVGIYSCSRLMYDHSQVVIN